MKRCVLNTSNNGRVSGPINEREAVVRSRRAFLTMGLTAAAGYGGWTWVRSRSLEGGVEWPLRGILRENEKIAETYFSQGHLSPAFSASQVDSPVRKNGEVGLGDNFDPQKWVLSVQESDSADTCQVTLAQIQIGRAHV